MTRGMRGAAAIVGIGNTPWYKRGTSPDSEVKMAVRSIVAAADAPRRISDTVRRVTPEELADLAHLRRARDLMDRRYADPLDVPAMARTALMSTAPNQRNRQSRPSRRSLRQVSRESCCDAYPYCARDVWGRIGLTAAGQ